MRHFLIQHIRGDWRHRPPRSERKARIGEREQIDCRRTARGVTRAEQIDAVMDTIDDACLRGDFATAADAIRPDAVPLEVRTGVAGLTSALTGALIHADEASYRVDAMPPELGLHIAVTVER